MLGGACLVWLPRCAVADDMAEDLKQLRAEIQKELADLKKREQKLRQEFLRLDQKSQLLDEQLRKLRATGTGPGNAASPPAAGNAVPAAPNNATPSATANANPPVEPGNEVAQNPTPATTTTAATPPAGGEAAPITGPSAEQQQARQVVETAPTLSTVGGVLTPKGQIVIDPSIEYDYWAQNQLGVNGFQIIPGITFGNIFVTRFEQNITTAAVTLRGGVTDRLELNAKIPYVYNTGSTSSVIPVGTNATLLSLGANGIGIGDIQFGASYQFNSGENGWPIFVGNFLFKTATGTSPFDVPIVTENQNTPVSMFLAGTPTKLATGTGFYEVEPSVTVLLPTAPGVLFANLQDMHNIARTRGLSTHAVCRTRAEIDAGGARLDRTGRSPAHQKLSDGGAVTERSSRRHRQTERLDELQSRVAIRRRHRGCKDHTASARRERHRHCDRADFRRSAGVQRQFCLGPLT
jgi:hypothetical protein